MSQTAARGLADATRWVGVAANMVDYLDDWLQTSGRGAPPAPPRRSLGAAKRFLLWVLEGVALNRRRERQGNVPTMAALSNLTIAVEVLSALPGPLAKDLDSVDSSIRTYVACLSAMEDASAAPPSTTTVRELRDFFDELLRQGDAARYAEFALGEMAAAK